MGFGKMQNMQIDLTNDIIYMIMKEHKVKVSDQKIKRSTS